MIKLKRVYEEPSAGDGVRILVERLWPRGISKEDAQLSLWMKEIAPSPELRKWYSHDVSKWKEFQKRYKAELKENGNLVKELKKTAKTVTVTLIYASKDEEHNSAQVLKSVLEGR